MLTNFRRINLRLTNYMNKKCGVCVYLNYIPTILTCLDYFSSKFKMVFQAYEHLGGLGPLPGRLSSPLPL